MLSKDWTNYLRLIRSLIYVLHKDSKTTIHGENMSKLYQALSNWTTNFFLKMKIVLMVIKNVLCL
jgi:hypothetical protein